MSYGRDDDRYARRELERIEDAIDNVLDAIYNLRRDLMDDDPMRTADARLSLQNATIKLLDGAVEVKTAGSRLPAPEIRLERSSR